MALDMLSMALSQGYTDETVLGGGALKGKNCVVSNIEEVADGVNVTFQWTLDNGTVQTETVLLPKGTQGEAGVDGKSAYEIWLEAGNTGSEEDFLNSLKGEDGFSPIITENADNTDDVYKLDIETKDGILTTPNLKGQGGEVTGSAYLATGSIDMENETVTFDQTFEEIKTAYLEGKAILAEMLVEGEAKYIFNPLYVLGDAIAFEWINSSAKLGVQINLMEDNSTALSVTSLEGGGSGESYDDTEIRELVNGKQDATIFIDATMSTVKDSWDNYLLDVDEEYRYSKVQDMLVDGKTVVLRVKVDNVLVELPCVSYESYTNATLTFAAPYYNSSTEEKGLYIAFCASTVGWKLGIKVVKEASSTDMSPFIIKSVYTEDSDGFTVDTRTTTPALWADWYPAFEAGRPVYWDLHKNSIDSNTDVIRLYPHSHGVYYEATGTKECQFIGIGGYPGYDSRNDTTKYYYIGWFRSGSAPASNYKFVKRYKIDEIPKGGTTGQVLAKKSNTNGDVEWINLPSQEDTLVVTGEYSEDDNGEWTVSNVNKTFTEIDTALDNGQNVILKIYPEGTTENPYLLYPAMHYKGMGVAFSMMVTDTDQISGLSVMIMTDGSIMASRNAYEFGKFTRIKTIEIPIDRIHKDYTGDTSTKVGLTKVNDYMKRLSFYIEETFFTENNIDTSNLLNIYLQASGQQGGALMTTNPYGTSDIFSPGRSGIAGTGGVRYIPFNLNVFGLNGNSGDSSTEFTVTSCKIRYEE